MHQYQNVFVPEKKVSGWRRPCKWSSSEKPGFSYSRLAYRGFSLDRRQCFGGPHLSSTGDPAEFVTPVGCPDGEGIALGESEGTDGAMAADGGAEGAALFQLTVAQVQRAPAAVCAQPPEGAVQVPGPAVRARGLGLQPKPLGIAALQRFIAALRNLPQDGVHFRAILPRSAEQLLQAPFGSRLEQDRLGCHPAIPGLCDHQLLQKDGEERRPGASRTRLVLGAQRRPGRTSNCATRPT